MPACVVARQLEVEYEWRETANADQVKAAQTKTSENTDSPEVWLQTKLAALLRMDVAEVDVNQPITRYGLDRPPERRRGIACRIAQSRLLAQLNFHHFSFRSRNPARGGELRCVGVGTVALHEPRCVTRLATRRSTFIT